MLRTVSLLLALSCMSRYCSGQDIGQQLDEIQQALNELRDMSGAAESVAGLSDISAVDVVAVLDLDAESRTLLGLTNRNVERTVKRFLRVENSGLAGATNHVAGAQSVPQLRVTIRSHHNPVGIAVNPTFSYSVQIELRDHVIRARTVSGPPDTAAAAFATDYPAFQSKFKNEIDKNIVATMWSSTRAAVVLPSQLKSQVEDSLEDLTVAFVAAQEEANP